MSGKGSRFDRAVLIKANALKNAIDTANIASQLGNKAQPGLAPLIHAYAAAASAWAAIAQVGDSVTWQEYVGLVEDEEQLKGDQDRLREDTGRTFDSLIRDRLREGFDA